MFEKASRLKLRFETNRGTLSTEDLWDLPLVASGNNVSLSAIAKECSRVLRESLEENFVGEATKDENAELGLNIVKRVIEVREAEEKTRHDAAAKRTRNQKILEIIERKQNEALASQDIESLKAMLEE